MKNQIFIKNLPYTLTQEELKRHFAPLGDITQVLVIEDRETKRSRGFGFITFATEASAQNAIDTMNGQLLEGRRLQVSLARPFVKKEESLTTV